MILAHPSARLSSSRGVVDPHWSSVPLQFRSPPCGTDEIRGGWTGQNHRGAPWEYHAARRGKTLVPLLVPIGMDGDPETRDGVRIVPSRKLGAVIRELSKGGAGKRGDGNAFVRAPCRHDGLTRHRRTSHADDHATGKL